MIENFIETNESIVFSDKGFISLKLNHFCEFFLHENNTIADRINIKNFCIIGVWDERSAITESLFMRIKSLYLNAN